MKKYCDNRKNQSGQAIIEMVTMLIAFSMCMVGLFIVIAFSIGNIDLLMCAKSSAEMKAYNKTHGNDGAEIYSWNYTTYKNKEENISIPFLVNDEYSKQGGNLINSHLSLNNKDYSDWANENYLFNDFAQFNGEIPVNFAGTPLYFSAHNAANLHRAKCEGSHNICGCVNESNINALSVFVSSRMQQQKIINAKSNTAYMPSMKIKDNL